MTHLRRCVPDFMRRNNQSHIAPPKHSSAREFYLDEVNQETYALADDAAIEHLITNYEFTAMQGKFGKKRHTLIGFAKCRNALFHQSRDANIDVKRGEAGVALCLWAFSGHQTSPFMAVAKSPELLRKIGEVLSRFDDLLHLNSEDRGTSYYRLKCQLFKFSEGSQNKVLVAGIGYQGPQSSGYDEIKVKEFDSATAFEEQLSKVAKDPILADDVSEIGLLRKETHRLKVIYDEFYTEANEYVVYDPYSCIVLSRIVPLYDYSAENHAET